MHPVNLFIWQRGNQELHRGRGFVCGREYLAIKHLRPPRKFLRKLVCKVQDVVAGNEDVCSDVMDHLLHANVGDDQVRRDRASIKSWGN